MFSHHRSDEFCKYEQKAPMGNKSKSICIQTSTAWKNCFMWIKLGSIDESHRFGLHQKFPAMDGHMFKASLWCLWAFHFSDVPLYLCHSIMHYLGRGRYHSRYLFSSQSFQCKGIWQQQWSILVHQRKESGSDFLQVFEDISSYFNFNSQVL